MWCRLDDVAERRPCLVGNDSGKTGSCVASVRTTVEIFVGNAEVGFVGIEIGVSDFEFESLEIWGVRLPADFEHRFVFGKTGIVTGVESGTFFDRDRKRTRLNSSH